MQIDRRFYGLRDKSVLESLKKAIGKETINKEGKYREKVLLFYKKNGIKVTQEGFEVKRSTLYR